MLQSFSHQHQPGIILQLEQDHPPTWTLSWVDGWKKKPRCLDQQTCVLFEVIFIASLPCHHSLACSKGPKVWCLKLLGFSPGEKSGKDGFFSFQVSFWGCSWRVESHFLRTSIPVFFSEHPTSWRVDLLHRIHLDLKVCWDETCSTYHDETILLGMNFVQMNYILWPDHRHAYFPWKQHETPPMPGAIGPPVTCSFLRRSGTGQWRDMEGWDNDGCFREGGRSNMEGMASLKRFSGILWDGKRGTRFSPNQGVDSWGSHHWDINEI